MRKILEERLENARNDFLNALKNGNATDREIGELQYTVTTYQDCLNLLPAPRTEQEILKDFETLGYKVAFVSEENRLLLYKSNDDTIFIYKNTKEYEKCDIIQSINLTIQEHKLLHELFEVWQWV